MSAPTKPPHSPRVTPRRNTNSFAHAPPTSRREPAPSLALENPLTAQTAAANPAFFSSLLGLHPHRLEGGAKGHFGLTKVLPWIGLLQQGFGGVEAESGRVKSGLHLAP